MTTKNDIKDFKSVFDLTGEIVPVFWEINQEFFYTQIRTLPNNNHA
jgi:hypothetical protein